MQPTVCVLDVYKPPTHMLILTFNFTIIRFAQVFIVVLLNILILFWLHLVIRKIPKISPSKYKPPKQVTQKTLR